VRDLRSTVCFKPNRRSSSSTLMASFIAYHWQKLKHHFVSEKWWIAMWFSRERNQGFIWLGMSAVNKFVASRMPFTRSTITMTLFWVISIPILEHQQHLLRCSPLMVVKPSLFVLVTMALGKMLLLCLYSCWCLVFGSGCVCPTIVTVVHRPMMTQRED